MHDIDRTQLETEFEGQAYEGADLGHESPDHELAMEQFLTEQGETELEAEQFLGDIAGAVGGLFGETEQEGYSPLNEAQEVELASELLEVNSEVEMEQFLGNLFSSAVRGVRNFAKSSTGRALGGVLKNVAKKALPIAGKALGAYFGGPLGSSLGGKLGGAAANLFEVELEGMSQEDHEFEVARQFVRFGASAAKQAAHQAHAGAAPPAAVRSAVGTAARVYAPGLLRRVPVGHAHAHHNGHNGHSAHNGHNGVHPGHPGHPGHVGFAFHGGPAVGPHHPHHAGHRTHPGHLGHPGHLAHAGHPAQGGHPGHHLHPGHAGHHPHAGHPGHPGGVAHHGHPGHAAAGGGFAHGGHGAHAAGQAGRWVRRGQDIVLIGYAP
jgi:hypothetical protein